MQFLYPGFLWALGVLAIPIIIHLFHFRRFKTVYFSNVSFLREVKEESATRSRLRHWLVLLSRLLFLTFLVLAFAQPFIPQTEDTQAAGQRTVSIYLDNSFSMDAIGDEVALLERGKEQALSVVNGYGEGDRFQLLTNDFEGRHQQLLDREQFITYLNEVEISPARKTLEQAEERMEQATAGQENPDFYYISDFQANVVEMEPDTGHANYFLPIQAVAQRNVSLDSVWLAAPVQVLNESALLHVKLTNHGEEPVEDAGITLTLNGERKAIGDVDVEANSFVVDTLSFTVTQEGWNAAEVSLTDYPITFDDTYFFTFFTPRAIDVLVINEEGFSPFFAGLSGQSFLNITNERKTQLNYATLNNYRLIVLNQLSDIPSGLRNELERFISEGGNVFVYPNRELNQPDYDALLQPIAGATYGPWREVEQSLQSINMEQGLFQGVFDDLPDNLLLPKVYGYFPIERSTRSGLESIIRLENGELFVAGMSYGAGRLYLAATPLELSFTDLPKHSLFVVMTVQVALSGTSDFTLAYTLGKEESVTLSGQAAQDQPFKIRGTGDLASLDYIPPQQPLSNSTVIRLSNTGESFARNMQAGIYELYHGADASTVLRKLAFNYDRAESAITLLDEEGLAEAFPNSNIRILEGDGSGLSSVVGDLSRGVSLWKLCLILALIFLGVEVLLLRLLPDR